MGGEQTLPKPAAAFVEDVRPGSWRGLVRIGLVTLVCTDQQLSLPSPPPPETLSLDAGGLVPLPFLELLLTTNNWLQ